MISIIIPAYNVEDYLRKCLDSIVYQNFQDFEVIIINDGSTDNTLSICNEYNSKFKNYKIFTIENNGMAYARNLGTSEAKGEYICYIDSDDWIAPNFLSNLYKFAQKNEFPDVIQCGFFYSYEDYLLTHKNIQVEQEEILLTKINALEELFRQGKIKNFPWGKLIKKEIAQKNPFPLIQNYEDAFWFYKIVNQCNRYLIISLPLYYYRQRQNSMTSNFNESSLFLLKGNHEQYIFAQKEHPNLVHIILTTYVNSLFNLYIISKKYNNDTHSKFNAHKYIFLNEISNDIKNFNKLSLLTKLKVISLKYNFSKFIFTFERIKNKLFKTDKFLKLKYDE